jgi:hypothetical protein
VSALSKPCVQANAVQLPLKFQAAHVIALLVQAASSESVTF